MRRLFVFVGGIAVLCCTAFLRNAGQESAHHVQISRDSHDTVSDSPPVSPQTSAEVPVVQVSHQPIELPLDFDPGVSSVSEVSTTTDVADVEVTSTTASRKREPVLEMIQKLFPETSLEAANAWADAYDGMDLSEVEFILEQKRSLSTTLDSQISGASMGIESSPHSMPGHSTETGKTALELINRNLKYARAIGYRSMVVLPEVEDGWPGTTAGLKQQASVTCFRNFQPGRMVPSPVPTHVAVNDSDGSMMFLLEGEMLTRRGDFQILPDQRLGLRTARGLFAIKDSPVMPLEIKNLQIMNDGLIRNADKSESPPVGRVPLVRIARPERLKSEDGIIFTLEESDLGSTMQPLPAAEVLLRTNCLEISNVDYDDDLRMLEHLR